MSPTSSTTSTDPLSSIASLTSTSTANAPKPGGNDPLANEETFLNLLVSQLQNQDPLNPVDSTTFVTQLTGYSQLEQLIGINKNTTPAVAATTTPATTTGTTTTGTTATGTTTTGTTTTTGAGN